MKDKRIYDVQKFVYSPKTIRVFSLTITIIQITTKNYVDWTEYLVEAYGWALHFTCAYHFIRSRKSMVEWNVTSM